MMGFEWTLTIVGAVLCLVYSWCLGSVARSYIVPLRKMSLAIGIVGTVVLASMAIVGSKSNQTYGVYQMTSGTEESVRGKALLSIAKQTIQQVGRRPSNDHVAYKDQNGSLAWVTKSDYLKIQLEK